MIFTKYLLLLLWALSWGCDSSLQQPNRPNRPVTPIPDSQKNSNTNDKAGITMAGMMNIENNGFYKDLLESTRMCQSKGLVFGSLRCSSWTGTPSFSITFNQNFSKVTKAVITPVSSNWTSQNALSQSIVFQARSNIIPINADDGWEIHLVSTQGFSHFEIRLRCEYCDLSKKEFKNIGVYKGSNQNIKMGVIPSMAQLASHTQN